MQTMDQLIASYDVPREPAKIVRLARSLHRFGIKCRNTRLPFWVDHGTRSCRDARDLVTFAREVRKAAA